MQEAHSTPLAQTGATPALQALEIHKSFGSNHVLRGVSLQVEPGEVVAIIGASGSGKSTFLRCINHLETIDQGHITVAGETLAHTPAGSHKAIYPSEREVRRICRSMGMVFQHFNLFPHMTVLQNLLEAPMTVKGLSRNEVLPRAEALLKSLELRNVLKKVRFCSEPLILG